MSINSNFNINAKRRSPRKIFKNQNEDFIYDLSNIDILDSDSKSTTFHNRKEKFDQNINSTVNQNSDDNDTGDIEVDTSRNVFYNIYKSD